jgi:hypothetical protein
VPKKRVRKRRTRADIVFARQEAGVPLTRKGAKIKKAMAKEYGAKKGERVFYASINAGKIKGAEGRSGSKRKGK